MDGLTGLFFGGTEDFEAVGANDSVFNDDDVEVTLYDVSDADEDMWDDGQSVGTYRPRKRRPSPSSTVKSGSSKRGKTGGGRPATGKKIAAEYDSDDARILTLKQQGYTDAQVAQRLVDEGRVRYVPKSVGSRWLRLRKTLEKVEDEQLDDELSDWHLGDDDELRVAVNIAEEKYQREMQKLEVKKWRDISNNLAQRMSRKKYSSNACKDRYDGLEDGTALMPIELDPDQAGRERMRIMRIAEAKKRRVEAVEEAKRAEEDKKKKARARRQNMEQRHQGVVLAKQARQAEKAQAERMKAKIQADREEAKAARVMAWAAWNQEITEKRKQRAQEDIIYNIYSGGKRLNHPAIGEAADEADRDGESDAESATSDDYDSDDRMSDLVEDSDGDQFPNGKDSDSEDAGPLSTITSLKTMEKKVTIPGNAKVTDDTLRNPRSIMTDSELDVLLFERGLPRRGPHETHPQIVARLAANDAALSVPELTELLEKYFDKGKSNKAMKIRRLQDYDASNSKAGMKGVRATDLEFIKTYEGSIGR